MLGATGRPPLLMRIDAPKRRNSVDAAQPIIANDVALISVVGFEKLSCNIGSIAFRPTESTVGLRRRQRSIIGSSPEYSQLGSPSAPVTTLFLTLAWHARRLL
jgi:hypothetical protein